MHVLTPRRIIHSCIGGPMISALDSGSPWSRTLRCVLGLSPPVVEMGTGNLNREFKKLRW